MWKRVAIFVSGLALGGAAGYFAGKYLTEEKALAETERQVTEVKNFYEARLAATEKAAELSEMKKQYAERHMNGEQIPVKSGTADDISTPVVYEDDEDEWGDAKRPKGAPKRKERRKAPLAENPPYYEEEGGAAIYPTEPDGRPLIISEQAFASERYEFEKKTLFWFSDDVVTDDDYQVLEDRSLIGEEWVHFFGTEDDPDVVHVRNPKIGCDYEIIRDKRSYQAVSGE